MDSFFREEGNLAALRELVRRVAQRVDADVTGYMRARSIEGPWPAGERVLALIGTDQASEAVVRHAKGLADALHAPLIALTVERPGVARDVRAAMTLAAQLGAELEIAHGEDLVAAVLEVAQEAQRDADRHGPQQAASTWKAPDDRPHLVAQLVGGARRPTHCTSCPRQLYRIRNVNGSRSRNPGSLGAAPSRWWPG